MKKILFVMSYMRLGGGMESQLIHLLNALRVQDYEISVLLLSQGEGCSDMLPTWCKRLFVHREETRSFKKQYSRLWKRLGEVAACGVSSKNPFLRKFFRFVRTVENRRFLAYVKKLFREETYDTVVGFSQGEASDVAMHAFIAKYKILFYRHGIVYDFIHDDAYYRKAQEIYVLSKGTRDELARKKNIPSKKIKLLHNILPIEKILSLCNQPCDVEFPIEPNILKILTTARISPEKGILEALQVAKLLKERDIPFIWFFVGNQTILPAYTEKCLAFIEEEGLADQVTFVGVTPNPFRYMKRADIVVQPSLQEAYGNTIVESMVLGKVVVSTKTHGGMEIIRHGENGFLCGFTPKEIGDMLQSVISENRQTLIKIQENAKRRAEEMTESVLQTYNQIFSR